MQLSTTTAKRRKLISIWWFERKGRRHLHFRSNRRTLEHLLGQMSLSGRMLILAASLLLLRQLLRSPPCHAQPSRSSTGNNDRIGRKIANDKATTQMGKMARNREFQTLSESWWFMTVLQMEQHPQSPHFIRQRKSQLPSICQTQTVFSSLWIFIHVHNKE